MVVVTPLSKSSRPQSSSSSSTTMHQPLMPSSSSSRSAPKSSPPPAPGPATANEQRTPSNNNNSINTNTNNYNAMRTTNFPPPPLQFIDIDLNERLPRPTLPASLADNPELVARAEELVYWAISSKLQNSPANHAAAVGSNNNIGGGDDTTNNPVVKAKQFHTQLSNLLNRKSDTQLLQTTLHSLISLNSGKELDRLVTNSKMHAQLIHLIMKLDPFVPPSASSSATTNTTVSGASGGVGGSKRRNDSVGGMDKLRDLDRVRRERRKKNALPPSSVASTVASSSSRARGGPIIHITKVQIAEPSIRHKENAKFVIPTLPYFNYQVADIYLHLLVTLISNNSILSMSAIRSIWGMLTDFGSRWIDLERKSKEEELKRIRRMSKKMEQADKKQRLEGEEEGVSPMMVQPPSAKRRKMDGSSQEADRGNATPQVGNATRCGSTLARSLSNQKALAQDDGILETHAENERPVPGMGGLSVEFVRDAFYSYDTNGSGDVGRHLNYDLMEEEIYSDRLASGRIQRLLLALVNIFRLCPRSKSDLQREIYSNFPHYKTSPPALYSWYTHMCLQMVHTVPTLEGPILCLFVDKALDMDVEIKINGKGLVVLDTTSREEENDGLEGLDGSENGVTQEPSPMMLKKRSFQQISTATKKNNNDPNASKLPIEDEIDNEKDHILEISERLDTLMTVLYDRIIQVTSFSPDSLSSAMTAVISARRLYRHLDGVFDKKVRTTDRSKFVQFVFFVLFGRENDALEAVGKLLAKREEEQQEKQQQLLVGAKDVMQTMKELDMDPDTMLPNSAPINVTDPLYRGFSAKLIDFFFNPSYAGDVPRQTVVCYLASFISRAKYVCPETVCECVAALLRWAEVYISAQQSSTGIGGAVTPASRRSIGGGVRRVSSSIGNTQHPCEIHSLFYTACQAAFYMMCFRGAEALKYYRQACEHKDDPDSPYADPESVDIGPERWKFLCGHALQPLKYCLESVRVEFLHLAEDFDVFLDPSDNGDEEIKKVEANKFLVHLWITSSTKQQKEKTPKKKNKTTTPKKRRRSIIISTAATQEKKRLDGGVGGLGRGSNPLNSFFPFDPYLLQKSYSHVHPYYRNWEDCIMTMENDEAERNEEKDGVLCNDNDDDANSEVSDLEDDEEEEEANGEEDESDDDEQEDDGSKSSSHKNPATDAKRHASSLHEDNHFEMEIRRSRAMSTGSQCSW